MTEDSKLGFVERLALDMYMRWTFMDAEHRAPIALDEPTADEVTPDPQGNLYRRDNGTFGEYWMEIAPPRFRGFTPNGDPYPDPPIPQVDRYRCLLSYSQRLVKHFKKEAKLVLEALIT